MKQLFNKILILLGLKEACEVCEGLGTQILGDYQTWGEVAKRENDFGFIEGSEEVIPCDFCEEG
tara:strand:+ start:789 stop:980 length:192 start_codon:yes stop_codon:yes gene_type:complete